MPANLKKSPHHKVTLVSAGRSCRIKLVRKQAQVRIQFLLSLLCDFSSGVNIRFCDSKEMLATNLSFRGKNKATDVLSFPALPGTPYEETGHAVHSKTTFALGDLLVCVPVCRLQAKQHRASLSQEMERMIIHGIVHLRGLDHERSEAGWKVMTALEKALIKELNSQFHEPSWATDLEKGSH